MQDQSTPQVPNGSRARSRVVVLERALTKRSQGVPSYTVPEAAALLSVSPEYLYRLVRSDEFPALRLSVRGAPRYTIPSEAVERLLREAAMNGGCTEVDEWTQVWRSATPGSAGTGVRS